MDKEIAATNVAAGMQRKSAMSGGWSPYTAKISHHEQELLRSTLQSVDVEYTPVAVSTQSVVDWTNYRFFCNTRVLPLADYQAAVVQINGSIKNKFTVFKIEQCNM